MAVLQNHSVDTVSQGEGLTSTHLHFPQIHRGKMTMFPPLKNLGYIS